MQITAVSRKQADAIDRKDADRVVGAAAAWDARARDAVDGYPDAVVVSGATGGNGPGCVNGVFDLVRRDSGNEDGNGDGDRDGADGEAGSYEAPLFKRRGGATEGAWLYLASDEKWYVSSTENKDARAEAGWAHSASAVPAGACTLPHEIAAWEVCVDGVFAAQPGMRAVAATRAEADAAVARAAALWDVAAARSLVVLEVAGVGGPAGGVINGTFDAHPTRAEGQARVYRHREAQDWGPWLFFATNNCWFVSSTEAKDTQAASGWLRSVPVAEGTLPHEVGGWEVFDEESGGWVVMQEVVVTARD